MSEVKKPETNKEPIVIDHKKLVDEITAEHKKTQNVVRLGNGRVVKKD